MQTNEYYVSLMSERHKKRFAKALAFNAIWHNLGTHLDVGIREIQQDWAERELDKLGMDTDKWLRIGEIDQLARFYYEEYIQK